MHARNYLPLISLFLLATFTLAHGQELKKVKIGYPAVSYNQIHIWVGQDAGLFKKHGLDTDWFSFAGVSWPRKL